MAGKFIVIVEDDLETLAIGRGALTDAGYRVECFEDGALAWDYLVAHGKEVDVVLLAKTLPHISGMELLAKIQGHSVLKNVPVIIQTIDTEEGKYENAIKEGAQFYLHKPLDPKKLVRLVKAAWRTHQQQEAGGGGSFAEKVKRAD